VYLHVVAEPIACNDVRLFDAFSCPCPPPSTFDKLLEMERGALSGAPYVADALAKPMGGCAYQKRASAPMATAPASAILVRMRGGALWDGTLGVHASARV